MYFKKLSLLVSQALVLLSMSNLLYAQDEFERVEVLDHPRFTLTNRLVLDLDIQSLPLDGYYKPIMVEAAASYQWTDFISFEPVRFGWSLYNHDTGLKASIERRISQRLEDQPLNDMKYHVGSSAFLNLLYSKSNFFNSAVVYHYWQLGSGLSYYNMDDKSQVALDLMLRVRFFVTENMTFNIRGGQSIGFKSDAPKNITFLGLGVGFAF